MSDPFLGTRGPRNASILIVGEAWTSTDNYKKTSFVSTGASDFVRILITAGIKKEDCLFTNVVNAMPPSGKITNWFNITTESKAITPHKGLYPQQPILDGLAALDELINIVQPKLIIAMGNYALWALTENDFNIGNQLRRKVPTGIGSYRGSQIHSTHGIPLLPVFPPAAALKNFPWMFQLKHDLITRLKRFKDNQWEDFERNFIIRPSMQQAVSTLNMLLNVLDTKPTPIAVDIETRAYHTACIGFAWSITDAICIPLMCVERDEGYWTAEEEIILTRLMRRLLSHPNLILRGQNFLYDAQYIWRFWFVKPYIAHDTMIMQHLCYPGTELNLGNLSSLYCHYHRYWKDDGKEWKKDMDEDKLWIYNCRDCVVTFEAAIGIKEVIEHQDMGEQFGYQIEQLNYILDMMIIGVLIDEEAKWVASHELELVREQYAAELERLLPEDVWPRDPKKSTWYTSTHQQTIIFTRVFGMKPYWNQQKRGYTMDDSALTHYGKAEPLLALLCDTLQKFRSLKTYATFTDMPLDEDKRMRSSFTPTASTFRWKSSANAFGSGGNLQNLPKGQEE